MARRVKKTSDATEILDRLTGDDSKLREMIAEEALNARVARMIYDARTRAGLTQAHLAELIIPADAYRRRDLEVERLRVDLTVQEEVPNRTGGDAEADRKRL